MKMMWKKEIKRSFKKTAAGMEIEPVLRRAAIEKAAGQFDGCESSDRFAVWISMVRCMDIWNWILFFAGVFVEILVLWVLSRYLVKKELIRQVCMIFSVMSGLLGIWGTGRLFYSNMTELGNSCFYNIRQLVVYQMVLFGGMSLVFIAAMSVCVSIRWQMEFMELGLYTFLPFTCSGCCYIGVLSTAAGRESPFSLITAGFFMVVFFTVFSNTPVFLMPAMRGFWGIAGVLSTVMFFGEMQRFLLKMEDGEILCGH